MNLLFKEQIPSKLDIPTNGKLLLAFSGGSDSLALMYLLKLIAPDRSEALYVNHRIRSDEELEKELELNKINSSLIGIKLNIVSLGKYEVENFSRENKCGIEASCRALRYKALNDYATDNGFDWILTAHHSSDQAETVLMRILEHSPFYTYQGILREDGHIYRPMLEVSKDEINALISNAGLEFSSDSTNNDIKYKRNFIRHRILPLLGDDAISTLSKIAMNLQEYNRKIEEVSLKNCKYYVDIHRSSFLSANSIARENVLYRASNILENKDRLSRSFIDEILKITEKGSGKAQTKYLDFIADKNRLRIFKRIRPLTVGYSEELESFGPFKIVHEKINDKVLSIDRNLLCGNVILRTSLPDDRINLVEGTKRVRELEKRAHVPYSLVLEDEIGIIAVFLRFLGANDRLSKRFISHFGEPIIIL